MIYQIRQTFSLPNFPATQYTASSGTEIQSARLGSTVQFFIKNTAATLLML